MRGQRRNAHTATGVCLCCHGGGLTAPRGPLEGFLVTLSAARETARTMTTASVEKSVMARGGADMIVTDQVLEDGWAPCGAISAAGQTAGGKRVPRAGRKTGNRRRGEPRLPTFPHQT